MSLTYSLNSIAAAVNTLQLNAVVWYQFNDSANLKTDYSGNGYTLIDPSNQLTPILSTSNYKIGTGSLEFDGTSDRSFYLPASSVRIYDKINQSGITIMFWMNLSTGTNISTTILDFNSLENNIYTSLNIERNQNGTTVNIKYLQEISDAQSRTEFSHTVPGIIDNNWHHVVWCISSTGKWTIYIDNVNVNTTIETAIYRYNMPSEQYKLGGKIRGNIDDFRIYNRVLSSFEIDLIYNIANVNGIVSVNGTIGIGTTLPNNNICKLDVNGAINATNVLINGRTITKEWNISGNYIHTNSNVVIGSNISAGNKLEVYNGDILIRNGNIKKYITPTVSSNYQLERWRDSSNYNTTGPKFITYTDGNVGIGTTNPGIYALNVTGNVLVTGNIIATQNITAYSSTSDERIKTVISSFDDSIDIIKTLSTFRYKTDNELARSFGFDPSSVSLGLSAQEVVKYIPEVVSIAPFDRIYDSNNNIMSKTGSNYLSIDYEKLVPVLVAGIKELNTKYDETLTKINELEKYIV
jgi:hypothetical protein